MKKTATTLALITLLFMLDSCKKHKAPKEQEYPIGTPEENPTKKKYVPVKFESTSLSFSLKYKEGTNLLMEINGSDGNKILITYSSTQIPLKLEKYKNTTLYKLIDYYRDGKQRIKQCTSFNYDASNRSYTPLGDIDINYDAKEQISGLTFMNDLNKLTREMMLTYNTAGNLSGIEIKDQTTGSNAFTYMYDSQTGIYKYVPYTSLFAIELENYFLNCSQNNQLSFSDQKNTSANSTQTYEYNQDGYPISIKINKDKTTQTFKISYMEFIN